MCLDMSCDSHTSRDLTPSLIVWAASGLLAWTGASSFAELGSAIPQNGGAQGNVWSFAAGFPPIHVPEQHILRMPTGPLFPIFLHGQLSLP